MQFHLSEELEMTRTVVRHFAEKEVAPSAMERDEKELFDRQLIEKMGRLGLMGIPWPELYGGAGGDFLTYTVVTEELSQVCASTASILTAHIASSGWPIYKFGTEEQKLKYLKQMAGGTKLGAGVFPFRDIPSTASGITAEASGDAYVLNGSNLLVKNGGDAEIYVVLAQSNSVKRKKQYCAFIIDKETEGCTYGHKTRKLGLKSLTTSEILFTNCEVPRINLLGKEGEGLEIAMAVLDCGHISAAAQAVGIAQGAMEAAVAYAKERKQFGKRIGEQQGISFKLADMATRIEAARLLAYQAAWRLDAGLSYSKEAAIAKKYATAVAVAATIEAVQVFGGYGYMREYLVERFMRDAKCIEADEGTEEMQTDVILRMLAD